MKCAADQLLSHIGEARVAGCGTISMEEFLAVIGTFATPEMKALVQARGDIEITFGADGQGTFCNSGPSFTTKVGVATLKVPRYIAGTVSRDEPGERLDFDADKTPIGKALFLEMGLEAVEISPHHVALRLPGGTFDQEFRF